MNKTNDADEVGLVILAQCTDIGADSLDTASIVASEAYHHLDELEGISRGSRKRGAVRETYRRCL